MISKFKRKAPLCKCGCGKQVKWNRNYKGWNIYIVKHASRSRKINPDYENQPFCACGCGEKVKWHKVKCKWNKYLTGHNYTTGNKGKKQTQKAKNKISKSLKGKFTGEKSSMYGKHHTEEWCKNHSKMMSGENHPMYGKRHNIKSKKKMSDSHIGLQSGENHPMFGKHHTQESKDKESLAKIGKYCGENNPNWKGGKSIEPYCEIWKDKEYKQDIRDRDDNECQNPDCWGKCNHLSLHVHHINYIKKDCHPWNLITLCNSCNGRANNNRYDWTKFYQNIMSEKYNQKRVA